MTPVAATVGVFDGMHRGHTAVVSTARSWAERAGCRLVAFTFDPSPRATLAGESPPPGLTSLAERSALLVAAGASTVRVVRFTPAFAEKGAERFLAEHVFPFTPLALLVVGYDFAMGHAREGSLDVLRGMGSRLGFAVHEVPAVLDGGEPVSSTRVRHALAAGDMTTATRLLGRPYTLTGTVIRGDGRGRSLGFPTANLDAPAARLRPAAGVYAVWVYGLGASVLRGVANVGVRPTFGGGGERVEVHLFDLDRDLVGTRLVVAFAGRLRPEIKFNGPTDLQRQIAEDAARARALLAAMDSGPFPGMPANPP